MKSWRTIRFVVWGLAVVVVVAIGLVASGVFKRSGSSEAASIAVHVGGPFTLVSDQGTPITDQDLKGHPSLVFFGYTHCPDVCPTALAEVTSWLATLGPEAQNLAVYFVTVDPDRDQVDTMHQYLTAFDPRIVGITGPTDAVHAMLDAYHVYYNRYDTGDGNYLMDHSASFYVLDRNGEFVNTIAYDDTRDDALAAIRTLMASG